MQRPKAWGYVVLVCALVLACPRPAFPQASVVGQWDAEFTWGNGGGIEAIHTILLPNNKVMFWQSWTESVGLWDIESNSFSAAAFPNVNIFCAGQAWLPDGRLMVVGGHINNYVGEEESNIYDPWTNTWANDIPDMNATNGVPNSQAGRWYPAVTTLGTGEILTLAGDMTQQGVTNPLPQIYNPETNTWRDLSTANNYNMPEYPRTFLAPNGEVVVVSNYGGVTESLNLEGTGSWTYLDNTPDIGDLFNYGPAVMYDTGKIAAIGGGNNPTNKVRLLDLNDANPEWTYGAQDMAQGRRQNDATILADGTVLVTGGSSVEGWNDPDGLVATAEIWDPETESMTQVAAADGDIYRGYHSTATLLPDGRVLITGGDHDKYGYVSNRNAEIYSPAYLFKGDRPEVTSSPAAAEYGDSIFIETDDAADIAKAIMIVPGATTHSQNWTQRANHLDFSLTEGGLNIDIPTNPNEAPPGYYMLFLVNELGVPSMAEWLQVQLSTLSGLAGDFNDDGTVDASDYTMWLDNLGAPAGTLLNDSTGSTIGMTQYQMWKGNFGNAVGSASGELAQVPEPTSLSILLVTLLLSTFSRGRRRSAL